MELEKQIHLKTQITRLDLIPSRFPITNTVIILKDDTLYIADDEFDARKPVIFEEIEVTTLPEIKIKVKKEKLSEPKSSWNCCWQPKIYSQNS